MKSCLKSLNRLLTLRLDWKYFRVGVVVSLSVYFIVLMLSCHFEQGILGTMKLHSFGPSKEGPIY